FPYHEDELVVVVSRKHPLAQRRTASVRDLFNVDIVSLRPGSWLDFQLMHARTTLGGKMKLRLHVTNYDPLCRMVEPGLGVGAIPRNVFQLYNKSLRIKALKFTERWARRQLGICVRSYEELPIAAKLLVDHLRIHN